MTQYTSYAEWLVSAYFEKRSACGDFKCEIMHTCDTPLSDIPPVTINTSDVAFRNFKETFSFHKCLDSLRSTLLYETSDTAWKVDHLCEQVGPLQGLICEVTWLEYLCGVEKLWSDARLHNSSPDDETKQRFIFPCVLPVAAPDLLSIEAMTETAGKGEKVIMKGLPLLAGHSVLWSFIGKCGETCEKIFGEEHPDVAQSLNNLAGLYRKQSEYEQAKPLYERALKMVNKFFKPDHPTVRTISKNYAILLKDMKAPKTTKPPSLWKRLWQFIK